MISDSDKWPPKLKQGKMIDDLLEEGQGQF